MTLVLRSWFLADADASVTGPLTGTEALLCRVFSLTTAAGGRRLGSGPEEAGSPIRSALSGIGVGLIFSRTDYHNGYALVKSYYTKDLSPPLSR